MATQTVECRICGEGDAESGAMIAPCDCTGSAAKVHPRCLQLWIAARPGDDAMAMRCEVCQREYNVVVRESFQCDRRYICSEGSLRHAAEGLVLVFLLGCALLAFRAVAPGPSSGLSDGDEETSHGNDAIDTALLFSTLLITIAVSGYAMIRVFRRWRRSSSISELHERSHGNSPRDWNGAAAPRSPMMSSGPPPRRSPSQLTLPTIPEEADGSTASTSHQATIAPARGASNSMLRRHGELL